MSTSVTLRHKRRKETWNKCLLTSLFANTIFKISVRNCISHNAVHRRTCLFTDTSSMELFAYRFQVMPGISASHEQLQRIFKRRNILRVALTCVQRAPQKNHPGNSSQQGCNGPAPHHSETRVACEWGWEHLEVVLETIFLKNAITTTSFAMPD